MNDDRNIKSWCRKAQRDLFEYENDKQMTESITKILKYRKHNKMYDLQQTDFEVLCK